MNQVAKRQVPSLDTIRIAAFNAAGAVGEWNVTKDTVTIGRVSTNDVALNDKKVSRNHATIELKPAGLLLRDLGSSNGTWVNGQKVSEAFLKDLDVVVIAGFRLQIAFERAARPAYAAAPAPIGDEATPAEDSNVIPMRGMGVSPAAAPEKVRTEVVSIPAMEAEAKNAAAAAAAAPRTEKMPTREVNQALANAKAEAARPTTMYVGGKKITRPATPAKTNAQTSPSSLASSEKPPRFTRKEKIGLLVGFLVWGMGWAMIAGGFLGMIVLAPKAQF